MKLNNVLVVYYVHNYRTLEVIEEVLRRYKIKYRSVTRNNCHAGHTGNKDLVIVAGGDGTFLRMTHHVKDTPVLLVSSDVNLNEGYYARATRDDFERKLKRIMKGKCKIIRLPRLIGIINKTLKTAPALNEIFVGSKLQYHTTRYWLHIGKKKEYQKSSGVLIATGSGSHGWLKSAGGYVLAFASKKISYVVREPYKGRLSTCNLSKGTVSSATKISVHSDIRGGIVAIDSSSIVYAFNVGDKLEVKPYKHPLRFVEF